VSIDYDESAETEIAEVPYGGTFWHCALRAEGGSLDGIVSSTAHWAVDADNGGDPARMLAEFMRLYGDPGRAAWDTWSLAMRALADNPPEQVFEAGTGRILERAVAEYLFERDEDCDQSVIERAIERAQEVAQ